ncbi:MAG: Uncharacterized protein G01um10148_681 [Parcubacteria group bacterium Gr01-1014_8]|nr:MAG: Uncharacterized protein G01um10148_681 [Parcubacteria group bacterium Gr01-1014_8]
MNSRAILIVVVLLVAALGGYGISRYQRTSIDTPAEENDSNRETAHLIAKLVKEDAKGFTITMKYPNFGLAAIDTAITAKIDEVILGFRPYGLDNTDTDVPYDLSSVYDSTYIGPDIVSARLAISTYMGGMHPLTDIRGLNFERESGRELTLDDALKLIDLSLNDVAKKARSELSKMLEGSFFPEGTEEKRENYATFIVNADSVIFIFQEYQVGPYAVGPQEVSFQRRK